MVQVFVLMGGKGLGRMMEEKATVWRFRMGDDYAAGVFINREGPVTREEAEELLERRYGMRVLILEPIS